MLGLAWIFRGFYFKLSFRVLLIDSGLLSIRLRKEKPYTYLLDIFVKKPKNHNKRAIFAGDKGKGKLPLGCLLVELVTY